MTLFLFLFILQFIFFFLLNCAYVYIHIWIECMNLREDRKQKEKNNNAKCRFLDVVCTLLSSSTLHPVHIQWDRQKSYNNTSQKRKEWRKLEEK